MEISKSVKILLATSLITATCTAWATPPCVPFSRIINVSHERPASIIFNPVDQSPTLGDHYQLKALGLYSDSEITALDNASLIFFKDQLGLDFTGTVSIPVGGGLVGQGLPISGGVAVLVPYINGQDGSILVVNDTKGNENKRIHVESGNIVLFSTGPAGATIPGGLHAGAKVENQDNYFYGNIDIAKKKSAIIALSINLKNNTIVNFR